VGSEGEICAAGNDGNLYVVDRQGYEVARFESGEAWLGFAVINGEDTVIVADGRDNSLLVNYEKNRLWAVSGEGCEAEPEVLYWQGGREDLNNDGVLDWADIRIMAEDWLRCTDCGNPVCYEPSIERPYLGDLNRDGYIDFADFAVAAQRWLTSN